MYVEAGQATDRTEHGDSITAFGPGTFRLGIRMHHNLTNEFNKNVTLTIILTDSR